MVHYFSPGFLVQSSRFPFLADFLIPARLPLRQFLLPDITGGVSLNLARIFALCSGLFLQFFPPSAFLRFLIVAPLHERSLCLKHVNSPQVYLAFLYSSLNFLFFCAKLFHVHPCKTRIKLAPFDLSECSLEFRADYSYFLLGFFMSEEHSSSNFPSLPSLDQFLFPGFFFSISSA